MSSKINARGPQAGGEMPWPKDAGLEVNSVRRAITDHIDEAKVDAELAPMMSQLLARLESFASPDRPATVGKPPTPSPDGPPSLQQTQRSLESAVHKITQAASQLQANNQSGPVVDMANVVKNLHTLKQEVIRRAGEIEIRNG